MSTKPRQLRRSPNGDAIRSARRVCALLESGEAMSAGWVVVKRGGEVTTGWDTAWGDTHKMLSGTSLLHYRVTKAAEEGAE